jgi:hypothetical protein
MFVWLLTHTDNASCSTNYYYVFASVQVFPMLKSQRSARSSSSSSSDGQNKKCLLCVTVCVTVYHCVYCTADSLKLIV